MTRKLYLLISLMVLFSLDSLAGLNRSTKIYHEFYDNGAVRKVTKVKIAASATWDLFSYYKKTTVYVTEYYPNGKMKSFMKRITKIGNSGKPCYEVVQLTKDYANNGLIRKSEKIICDKGKIITKHYDEIGNLVFVKIDYASY